MTTSALCKSSLFALLAVAVLAAARDSAADPAPLQTGSLPAPVRIDAFQRPTVIGLPLAYTGGPVGVELVVQNTTKTDQNNVTVTFEYAHEGKLSQVVNVPALGKTKVTFTDPNGLPGACSPRSYGVSATTADGHADVRRGVITPTCKISASLVDPWNLAEPDRVVEQQKNTVYFDNAVVEHATCADGVKIKGQLTNHSKISSPSLIVQGKAGTEVLVQTAAALPLAAGESKTVYLTHAAGVRHEVPDRLDVSVLDWTHGLGSSLVNQGITVKTTKSCSLAYGWGDQLALAPAK